LPRALPIIVAGAAASLLLLPAAPGYDAWMWLLWGREVAGGALSTVDGPAFKPLPVAVCALLAPLGGAAPWLWVVLVRIGAVTACWLAFRLARRLADGSVAAGVLAAGAVALAGTFAFQAATGAEAPLVIAFALAGGEAWRRGRERTALVCGAACALLRVEAWPFLVVAGVLAWRRDPRARRLLAGLALAIPAAWFVPEWIGSGDPLRSGARARIPMPGQPALADVPSLASLRAAAGLALWPLWAGVVVAALRVRAARPLVIAGAAWVALVALMAQAGFSGEQRYLLPGVALLSIAGAAGWWKLSTSAGLNFPHHSKVVTSILAIAIAVAAAPRIADLPDLRAAQLHQRALARDLDRAIARAGGPAAVRACGTPYVGPLRGPLMAYHLHVPKRAVEPDALPRPPGVVFRARLTAASAPAPTAAAPFRPAGHAGEWEVLAACTRN
jgi:hypothetical protein